MTPDPIEEPTIDVASLAAWMDKEGLHGALRIPTSTAPATRDEGILREWRIIEALTGTDVPHTEAIAVCKDPSVLGRTFYIMGFVDGWSPMALGGWAAPYDSDPEE